MQKVNETDYTIHEVHLLGLLGERFPNMPFAVYEVKKKNEQIRRAVSMEKSSEIQVYPMYYVDDMTSMEKTEKVFHFIVENLEHHQPEKILADKDLILHKDNLYLYVINKEKNKEFLERYPHEELLDLAVCLCFSKDDMKVDCDNKLLATLGLSYEQAFDIALKNTLRDTQWQNMNDIIMEFMGVSEEEHELDIHMEKAMVVISNIQKVRGAGSALLNTDVLFEVAEYMNSDLYILPSSIHEIIAVSADFGNDECELKDMVKTVNDKDVDPEEILSYNIYHFNKNTKQLTLVA